MNNSVADPSISEKCLEHGLQALSISDIISVVSLAVAAIGISYIAKQLHTSAETNRMNLMLGRYQFITDVQKFCFENPQYFKFWVGSERYKKIAELSLDETRDIAAKDVIIDAIEYLLLSGNFDNKAHQTDFAKRVLRNPQVQAYFQSEFAGSFRPEFQKLIDEVMGQENTTF